MAWPSKDPDAYVVPDPPLARWLKRRNENRRLARWVARPGKPLPPFGEPAGVPGPLYQPPLRWVLLATAVGAAAGAMLVAATDGGIRWSSAIWATVFTQQVYLAAARFRHKRRAQD